ncbi:MAG: hypothetical protein GX660_26360 [Clostridiaceae bacterium]|nr:hypothetical protein [Clostridiaceae bacterium]
MLKDKALITNQSDFAYDYWCPENISKCEIISPFEECYRTKSYIVRARG